MANETVARHYEQLKVPFIYRIHERKPDSENSNDSRVYYHLGITIKGRTIRLHRNKLRALMRYAASRRSSGIDDDAVR